LKPWLATALTGVSCVWLSSHFLCRYGDKSFNNETVGYRRDSMPIGTVKWFDGQKGYGFIQPDQGGGRDVFVHISAVEQAGLSGLNEGQKVEYEEKTDSRTGKTSAVNLQTV
jgi:CspA family cold shock protein